MTPLCQTLSNVLEMSKKKPLIPIGGLSSKDLCISCIMLKICEVQESPGAKSD